MARITPNARITVAVVVILVIGLAVAVHLSGRDQTKSVQVEQAELNRLFERCGNMAMTDVSARRRACEQLDKLDAMRR